MVNKVCSPYTCERRQGAMTRVPYLTRVGLVSIDGGHEGFSREGIECSMSTASVFTAILAGVAAVLVGLVSFLIRSSAAKGWSHA